jgi:hypothetical protein
MGLAVRIGVETALDEINDKGGGVGQKLKWICYDDQARGPPGRGRGNVRPPAPLHPAHQRRARSGRVPARGPWRRAGLPQSGKGPEDERPAPDAKEDQSSEHSEHPPAKPAFVVGHACQGRRGAQPREQARRAQVIHFRPILLTARVAGTVPIMEHCVNPGGYRAPVSGLIGPEARNRKGGRHGLKPGDGSLGPSSSRAATHRAGSPGTSRQRTEMPRRSGGPARRGPPISAASAM